VSTPILDRITRVLGEGPVARRVKEVIRKTRERVARAKARVAGRRLF
jgi:hypothetical protein